MDHITKTIEDAKKVVAEKENELIEAQKLVNSLCKMAGKPPVYNVSDVSAITSYEDLKGDEYYGQPLATAITLILDGRKLAGYGPATIRDIYEQLVRGGYLFKTKNEANAMRGIRISMRNNKKFHRLPNGQYCIKSWYPTVIRIKNTLKEGMEK